MRSSVPSWKFAVRLVPSSRAIPFVPMMSIASAWPGKAEVVALIVPIAPLPKRIAPIARSSVSMRCTALVAA